jgi:hypothetical protein
MEGSVPVLVTRSLRAVLTCLTVLAAPGIAQAQNPVADCVKKQEGQPGGIQTKKIRIINNSDHLVFAIIQRANAAFDDWMVGLCQIGPDRMDITFPTQFIYRVYVGGTAGIQPKEGVEVTVPWYTRLTDTPTGINSDEFADWFNGNRVLLYEAQTTNAQTDGNYKQIFNDYTTDQQTLVPGKTAAPCAAPIDAKGKIGQCVQLPIVKTKRPIPDPDRNQLMEHTFSNVVTKNGRPFSIVDGVGYNISSVDQVYLPVAMQVLAVGNTIGYIGTTIDLTTFRTTLNTFIAPANGWAAYARDPQDPAGFNPPPRVPGAYALLLAEFGQDKPPYKTNDLLVPNCRPDGGGCAAIAKMKTLYETCVTSTAGFCANYNPIIQLFLNNFKQYQQLSCHNPNIGTDSISVMKRIYGWVPFNDVCNLTNAAVNDLSQTPVPPGFTFPQLRDQIYTDILQKDRTQGFNPYGALIHDQLKMQAYSFSIDDAIGFQSYPGDGIIITLAGCGPANVGLNPCIELDTSKKIVVNMGVVMPGVPEWASWGPCSNDVSKPFDPAFASALFYTVTAPSDGSPCVFTATDTTNKKYQLRITQAPDAKNNIPVKIDTACANISSVTDPKLKLWCQNAAVNPPNNINARPVFANVSTHAFDNKTNSNTSGFSDLLWHNGTTGQLKEWLQFNGTVQPGGACTPPPPATITPDICGTLTNVQADNTWTVVGQRDFNNDGRTDILWRNSSSGELVIWLLNAGTVIGGGSPGVVADANWSVAGTGDFDGDGVGDILWFNTQTGEVVIWLIDGTTLIPKGGGSPGSVNKDMWEIAATGDFNGDGKADILWRNKVDGQVVVWTINGASVVTPPFPLAGSGSPGTAGSPWRVAAVGDFNGDNKYDILWFNPDGQLVIWLLNGGNPFSQAALLPLSLSLPAVPVGWTPIATGDYNFDGVSDILWRNDSSGQMLVWCLGFDLGDSKNGIPPSVKIIDEFPKGGQASWGPGTWTLQTINAN